LAISSALLFPDPSIYSEKSKSVAVPVPLLLVVTAIVLLEAEAFPAASFAFT
jgi:multisubunit Na+/H+ antiporter MnhC subunit